MYTLFNEPSSGNIQKIISPKLEFVLDLQKKNLDRVIEYYRTRNLAVPSGHFIVSLLQSLPTGSGMELRAYKDYIADYIRDFAHVYGLTSSTTYGRSFSPGVLLGKDSEEILIATTEDFSTFDLELDWVNAASIKYLAHPKTDFSLAPLNGEGYSKETGVSVITINVPLLACQYRLWLQRESEQNSGDPKSIMQFVASYPLTNALVSFLEVAYFNLIYSIQNGTVVEPLEFKHPFYLMDYRPKVISHLNRLLQVYIDKNTKFENILKSLPSISNSNLLETFKVPKVTTTRQLVWALSLSRLKLVGFFLLWSERSNTQQNKQELNSVRRALIRMRSDKMMDVAMSYRLTQSTKAFIRDEIEPFL